MVDHDTCHMAFCLDSARRRLLWGDHFLGDQVQDEWRSTGDAGGSAVVVDGETGGICRITTDGDTNDAYRIDWNDIRSLHMDQRVCLECRVKAGTTDSLIYLALWKDGNERIMFWKSNVDTNWQIFTQNGGATTDEDSGVAVDTSYHIFRIMCHTHGSNHIHFYIDGTETSNSPVSSNLPDDAGDELEPYLWIRTAENATKSMDIDYVVVSQDR